MADKRLRERVMNPQRSGELKVFISNRESICDECSENLGSRAWITLAKEKGALCLTCADLDHLVFLPSGDAALTRRARKYSTLSAVVLKWSRPRNQYERQGLLVEQQGLEKAEEECLADSEVRELRRNRETVRRNELDRQYVEQFAARVRELFPKCPSGREREIAEHACLKYSGRRGAARSDVIFAIFDSRWIFMLASDNHENSSSIQARVVLRF
jgi:hypothetical protein